MNEEILQQLEFMNRNLNAIVVNQAEIYCLLREIEDRLPHGDQ
nr:hypothetical protein [uncultured Caproiciproducens sp.]